tara:strand:+ start:1944 stop:2273 length:330 start_codon:yes stop_codon:yes gene_type:complete
MKDDLPQTIANIVLYYIKKHYHKYLETNNIKIIPEDNIKEVVESFYTEKEKELKKFIRNTMRKNFPEYDNNLIMKTGTEEIILEIFDDKDFSITKVSLEISNYQKGLNQ